MRRILALTGIISLALAFAACSGTAATPAASTSVGGSTAPTVGPTVAASIPIALPTGVSVPSGGVAIPSFHADPAFEAVIPSEIGGEKVTTTSFKARDFTSGSDNAELMAVLGRLGRSIDDVTIAGGTTATSKLNISAIRIAGANQDALLAELVAAGQKDASPLPAVSRVNIAGKDFTVLTPVEATPEPVETVAGESADPTDTPGPPDPLKVQYLYAHGDIVFQIGGATQAQINEVATKLP